MFTSTDIRRLSSSPDSIRQGREGVVFLGSEYVVKEQRYLNGVDADIPCHLAERRRRAIHGFFNALSNGSPLSFESGEVSAWDRPTREIIEFAPIRQASSSGDKAIGVLPRIEGQMCLKPSPRLYESARLLGAQIDAFGDDNVVVSQHEGVRRFTILETIGGIGLEGLLQLQALWKMESEEFSRALYFYTQASLFDGVAGVPTSPWQGMQFAIECGFRRMAGDDDFQEVVRPAVFWHGVNRGGREGSHDHLARFEVSRIERIIGTSWSYQVLDTVNFSNAAEFGVVPGFVECLREKREQMIPAMARLKPEA